MSRMSKKSQRSIPHPDDFMVVAVALEFQAKLNPDVEDPQEFETTSIEETFRAADAAEYLEKVLGAIRDRRLYGFMAQQAAESPVGAGEWIAMTTDDLITEMRKQRTKPASTGSGGDN
jgi:hypothetical protein